jgi:hypothetical protein
MSIELLEEAPPMADKAKIVTVKVDADVLESARIVAAFKGVPIQDLLSDILRPALARMEREEIEKRQRKAGGDEGEPGPRRVRPRG